VSAENKSPAVVLRAVIRLVLLGLLGAWAAWAGWTQAWVFFVLLLVMLAVNLTVVRRKNPGIVRARMKKDEPVKPFDKLVVALGTPLTIAIFVVAGLDVLVYQWSPVPPWAWGLGLALFVLGDVPVLWSLVENPYLERMVRIQEERGHKVITTGPYRFVRHPMYVGVLSMIVAWPLLLGSLWALLPAAGMIALMLYRAAAEDRMLHEELPGYRDFAAKTRYRLVPGVW
jgi:protein-S-isoprenylcysteine O-methyltransferase Ste14